MESEFYRFGWTSKLETGIEVIDVQHRRYFELLDNYLETTNELSTTPEQVVDLAETFNFLRQYAKEHFSSEEAIMLETKYPAYEQHQAQHLHFSDKLEKLYRRLRKCIILLSSLAFCFRNSASFTSMTRICSINHSMV